MGSWWSRIFGPRDAPVDGVARISNIIVKNFRGILGVIVPIAALSWRSKKDHHYLTVELVWMWMFWFFLFQPIAVPCTAMIPIFMFPMCGVMSTVDTVNCYFNEGVCLFILSSMLILLWNNSGFDRRTALFFLASGDACQFSGKRLVFKCSVAAYILSMFSNRLIATSTLCQYVTSPLLSMSASTGNPPYGPDYDEIRYIVNNAIQTSASIGSIAIIHSAYTTLLFRAVWTEAVVVPASQENPDIFNYLQYSAYAFPVSFVMFLFNVFYHMFLINCLGGKGMPAAAMNEVRNNILKLKETIPKRVTTHEKLAVFFSFFALIMLFTRWNKYMDKGWAGFNLKSGYPDVPLVKDACVVALFVIALHILPRSFHFYQFIHVYKKSELTDVKPESAILWWRFVDKNTNYAYFFVFGAAIVLCKAVRATGLGIILAGHFGKDFTANPTWCTGLFLVCLVTCILANFMCGSAAVVCFLPFVINMAADATVPWVGKLYIAVLGVGVGASLGFMLPFLYTPAYFCHHTGKVPIIKMVLYNFLNAWGCLGILWFSLCYWAPYLWDPKDLGIKPVIKPILGGSTTTEKAGGGGGGESPPAPPPPEEES